MTPEEALDAYLAGVDPDTPVGLAVSGGGDSAALLHAAALRGDRARFAVATVDHGLREGSAAEAAAVAAACAALDLPHDTLAWTWDGRGNLQDSARDARRRLLADWAHGAGRRDVLLGHTADDQAETVLLRLARGSGVDGLAGMKASILVRHAVCLGRPFLGLRREDLRAWLRGRGLAWIEDPSNEDARFARARARLLMGPLAELGLTRERLLRTAEHMQRARAVLDAHAVERARDEVWQMEDGSLRLRPRLLAEAARDDTSARILAAALMWVGGRSRRPRWDALLRLATSVSGGRAATLWGCRVSRDGPTVLVAPEPGRAGSPPEAPARPRAGVFAHFVGAGEGDG